MLRQEIGPDQEEGWNEDVVQVVNDVLQPIPVKPRDELLHAHHSGKGAIRGINQNCQCHEPECILKFRLFNKQEGEKGDNGA